MKITLKAITHRKANGLRHISWILTGFFLGSINFELAILSLALAIIFDAIATHAEVRPDPANGSAFDAGKGGG